MKAPIPSPFGDEPALVAPQLAWPQPLVWDARNQCFALRYQSPMRAKLRCLPKELRRAPLQFLLLFILAPVWFMWTAGLRLPLPIHLALSLILSPLSFLAIMVFQWNSNKSPGLATIRAEGLADQFPAKTAAYRWADLKRAVEDDGDLFFYVGANKGSYFPREAFANPNDGQLFFYLVQSLIESGGANWNELAQKYAPRLPQA